MIEFVRDSRRGKLSAVIRPVVVCAVALVLSLGGVACGSSGPAVTSGGRPSTTAPGADGRPPSLRIVLGGDSVMASLVPAVRAALGMFMLELSDRAASHLFTQGLPEWFPPAALLPRLSSSSVREHPAIRAVQLWIPAWNPRP